MKPNPVYFTCLRSGNRVAFEYEHDIDQMRKHEGYAEVKDDSAVQKIEQPQLEQPKLRGRPRKGN